LLRALRIVRKIADILGWEERRLNLPRTFNTRPIDPYLAHLAS